MIGTTGSLGFREAIAPRRWCRPGDRFTDSPATMVLLARNASDTLVVVVIRPVGWLRSVPPSASLPPAILTARTARVAGNSWGGLRFQYRCVSSGLKFRCRIHHQPLPARAAAHLTGSGSGSHASIICLYSRADASFEPHAPKRGVFRRRHRGGAASNSPHLGHLACYDQSKEFMDGHPR